MGESDTHPKIGGLLEKRVGTKTHLAAHQAKKLGGGIDRGKARDTRERHQGAIVHKDLAAQKGEEGIL